MPDPPPHRHLWRSRPLRWITAPAKQQLRRELVLTSHQTDGHPGLQGLLDQSLLLIGIESAPALHSEDLDLCMRHRHISGYGSYSSELDVRTVRFFWGC